MPDLFERITECKSPTEALLLVAKELDQVENQLTDLEERVSHIEKANIEGWDEWSGETPPLTDDDLSIEWKPPEGVAEKIEELKGELIGNEDVNESKSIRAKIYLLEDQLKPPPEAGPDLEQQRADISIDDSSVSVSLPVVTLDEEDDREEFARSVLKIPEYYGDQGEEYVQSYRKGGPLLFYYSDRDFIMSQPDEVKRTLVFDVERSSTNEAHEMARDILKDVEANGPDIAVENQVKIQAAGN